MTPAAPAGGRPAVILFSGGLDSATVLALALGEGWKVHALTFSYGQRHTVEVERARDMIARHPVARHAVADIDLRIFGRSALTSDEIPVPAARPAGEIAAGAPSTYVPARNTIFLSYALAWAEVIGARDLFIGVNALDYSGYPDCRPEFIAAFEALANVATRAGAEERARFTVHAPLIGMRKHEIIALGMSLGVDYGATTSCYDPDTHGRACGRCEACGLRREGFRLAGVADPTTYRP
ncbi:MAG: 7-cyano-7-deazaguanine synthase QueC [Gemmatimonadaceae bacterium]|nr:7-cyano-7-deazaguanine synthase QueC [Gemmatimonadaceae bacterium]